MFSTKQPKGYFFDSIIMYYVVLFAIRPIHLHARVFLVLDSRQTIFDSRLVNFLNCINSDSNRHFIKLIQSLKCNFKEKKVLMTTLLKVNVFDLSNFNFVILFTHC